MMISTNCAEVIRETELEMCKCEVLLEIKITFKAKGNPLIMIKSIILMSVNVIKLTQMDGEGSPLYGGRVEVAVFDVQIPGTHCLRPETIEQGNFGSAGDAN